MDKNTESEPSPDTSVETRPNWSLAMNVRRLRSQRVLRNDSSLGADGDGGDGGGDGGDGDGGGT